jgi:hypothetical protein
MMHQPQAIGIKRGFKATRTPTVCGVSFEALPVWLWALRLKEWIHIYITESDERQIHQAHPQLRSLLGQRLVTVEDPPHHDPRCTLAEVWWVSGSEAYVKGLTLPESVAQVIWVSNVGRRLPSSLEALADWQSISHARVGGVTNARGWFGFMGLDTISIPTDLQRTLAHVLKHSIRGQPCVVDIGHRHYTPSDRLSIRNLSRPIVFPTFLSRTGWSQRSLDASELALCYDLPEFVPWVASYAQAIVPLQILRTVMDTVLDQLAPPTDQMMTSKPKLHHVACVDIAPSGLWGLVGIHQKMAARVMD